MRIGIALFEDAEELDFAGPWEVLAAWSPQWPDDGVEVLTVADTLEPVRCAKGLRVLPDATWETAGRLDVLVYPGGMGTRPQLGDEAIRDRIRGLARDGTLMTSVCTGSLVYADAGLLDGRPATTHWAQLDLLALAGPRHRRPGRRPLRRRRRGDHGCGSLGRNRHGPPPRRPAPLAGARDARSAATSSTTPTRLSSGARHQTQPRCLAILQSARRFAYGEPSVSPAFA